MYDKKTEEEIKKIEKKLRKITQKIREGKDKHPGRVIGKFMTKIEENNLYPLKIKYYPQSHLRLIVRYKDKEYSISLGQFPIELNKYQKAFIRILAELNKDLNQLGRSPYIPEVHLSKYESTKHHPELFWKNASEDYKTYRQEIEDSYGGQLYGSLLSVVT